MYPPRGQLRSLSPARTPFTHGSSTKPYGLADKLINLKLAVYVYGPSETRRWNKRTLRATDSRTTRSTPVDGSDQRDPETGVHRTGTDLLRVLGPKCTVEPQRARASFLSAPFRGKFSTIRVAQGTFFESWIPFEYNHKPPEKKKTFCL